MRASLSCDPRPDILMKEDDLEFASFMVQNLNVILMTAPELAGVRKGFKNLSSQPSRDLFCVLYR